MGGLPAPFTLSKSWFRLLVPRVFYGVHTSSKDVLGKMPVCGQFNDGMGVETAVGVSGGQVVCTIVHDPVSVIELVF